jgi:hypothetical protein
VLTFAWHETAAPPRIHVRQVHGWRCLPRRYCVIRNCSNPPEVRRAPHLGYLLARRRPGAVRNGHGHLMSRQRAEIVQQLADGGRARGGGAEVVVQSALERDAAGRTDGGQAVEGEPGGVDCEIEIEIVGGGVRDADPCTVT